MGAGAVRGCLLLGLAHLIINSLSVVTMTKYRSNVEAVSHFCNVFLVACCRIYELRADDARSQSSNVKVTPSLLTCIITVGAGQGSDQFGPKKTNEMADEC